MTPHTPSKPSQLMLRRSLHDLPPVELPDGFSIRPYRSGDDEHWERILRETFGEAFGAGSFQRIMRSDYAFRPERVLFVCRGDEPVGTASAYYRPRFGKSTGYIHYVAVSPAAAGMRLGLQASLAALHQLAREGRTQAVLHTDDDRLPALKTYLKLGFAPLLTDETHRERWRNVFDALQRPELDEQFAAELNGPLFERLELRENLDSPDRYRPRRKWLPDRMHQTKRGGGDPDVMSDEVLYRPSRLGTATVFPAKPVAGSTLSEGFQISYTAGPDGLPAGAIVKFGMRGQNPLGFSWQINDPARSGFMKSSAPHDCRIEGVTHGFRIIEGELKPGETVTLKMEATDKLRWNPVAARREYKVVVMAGPDEPETRLPEPLVIDFVPGKLHHLETILPGTQREVLYAHITARDEFENRIPLDGIVHLEANSQNIPMREGLAVAQLSPPTNGVLRLQARLDEHDAPSRSNVCAPPQEQNVYFGDLHCHDYLSESEGYPDDVYRWARDTQRLDFLSVSPQLHGYLDNETWTICKYMNERFLEEGRFVTLLAYEWQHCGYGDKVVHYLGGDQPYLPEDDRRYGHPAQLYEALRASDAFIIGHHPAYPIQWVPGTEYSVVETDVERLIEIWSNHGSSEGYDPADRPLKTVDESRYVMNALRQGLRLGFVGGSDSHSGRPGGSAKEPGGYWGGLAAVWAPELTRRGIFQSLYNRHTYALTDARIVLKMTVNGALMGSEVPAADSAQIQINVWVPGRIAKVEIMKNARVLREFKPEGKDEFHLEYEDPTGGAAFYHCRVTQEDGELAVGSPVWVG